MNYVKQKKSEELGFVNRCKDCKNKTELFEKHYCKLTLGEVELGGYCTKLNKK